MSMYCPMWTEPGPLPHTKTFKFDDPPAEESAGDSMEFRLVYEGPLDPQKKESRVAEKHAIRRAFHPQLKELWEQHQFLRTNIDYWAGQYNRDGFRYIPLISEKYLKRCALDILFLRRDMPGNVIANGGDIDNRLKTLFDGLRITRKKDELGGAVPQAGEDPFYCLMEDDSLITEVRVTTDRLLTPLTGHIHDVVLVIHVRTPGTFEDY